MKTRKGSRSKIPFLVTSILLMVLVLGVNSQALAGLNLEVPIDMVDHGLEVPNGAGTTNFNRARIFFDANDYDGDTVNYYFEIVAKNIDSSAKPVYFRRTTNTATNHATINVPVTAAPGTFARYRVQLSINPLTGKNQYLVRLTKTTSTDQLIVSSARLIVQQTNATKTRIQIPLVQKNHDIFQNGSGRADTTTSAVYTQGDSDKYSLWKKDSSQYADISGWTLEAVLDNKSTSATTYAALHRVSDGATVADSEVSLLGTTIALVDTSFTNTATNFTDGSKFELKIRSSISGQRADLGRASLYVSLTNLSQAEVLYRVSRKVPSGPDDVVAQRILLDTTLFTNPAVYLEATGRCEDNTPLVFLRDHDANPSGTGGTDVSGSGINFNNVNRDIVRTAAITPDSGDNFYVRVATNANTLKVMHAWVVVAFPTASCPTPGTPISPSPGDGASGVLVDDDLSWAQCSETDSYDVYFGEDSNPPFLGNTTNLTYPLPTNEYCTKYYWKIVAKSDEGCSTVGDIWDFTTEDGPPETPGSPDPGHLDTGVSANAILDWSDCDSTDTYDLYLGTSDPPVLYASDITDSNYDPDLDWGTHYYWKVVAKSGCGTSTSSNVWEFTTGPEPAGDLFVWDSSPNQGSPYDSWDTAAHTITKAINNASSGETIMVRAGTKYADKVIMKDGVNLVAEEGVKPSIAMAAGAFYAVVEFRGPMTGNLTGFTIQSTGMGSGVFLDGSGGQVNATVTDCDIPGSLGWGVGVRLDGAVNATITGCTIYNDGGPTRVGIGNSGFTALIDRLSSNSSVTILGNTIGTVSGQGFMAACIRFYGDTGASNIQVTIGGNGVNDANTISYSQSVGIVIANIDKVTIENNDISNNGKGGIVLLDTNTVSPHIKNNDIHHQTNAAGINIGGASNVTIGDGDINNANSIYANKTGVTFHIKTNNSFVQDIGEDFPKVASSGTVTISGNNIFSNSYAGIAVKDGITGAVDIDQNNIYSNTRGGIRIRRKCTLNISRNTIRDNLRGGIHTGKDTVDGGGFGSTLGTAVLTIEKNKIYDNGQGGMGGGIDVRHASGTIYNNLIYGNHRGGIRFGDYITEIVNNTVVYNGENDFGAGIAYDDLAGAVNDSPAGVPPAPLFIRNNISAYNEKTGIRACFDNTSEERDYNLVYSNNGTGETNCGWPDSINMRCANKNFGGCGGKWNLPGPPKILPDGPNNIIADPKFVKVDPDYYQLQGDSPAKNAGDDFNDMGAYGGSDPIDW